MASLPDGFNDMPTNVLDSVMVCLQVKAGTWELGDGLCDTWVAFDVMCCTASILNLTAISVDRSVIVSHWCVSTSFTYTLVKLSTFF